MSNMSDEKEKQYREEWRKAHCSDDYEISNDGKLRNIKSGKILSTKPGRQGYVVYAVRIMGKIKMIRAHRLVAEAFLVKPVGKDVINHINSNRSDNRVENLEWCTIKENCIHGVESRKEKGIPYQTTKLTADQVEDILKNHKTTSMAEFGRRYGVNPTNVRLILKGEIWRHVGDRIGFDYSEYKSKRDMKAEIHRLKDLVKRARELLSKNVAMVGANEFIKDSEVIGE